MSNEVVSIGNQMPQAFARALKCIASYIFSL